MDAHCPVCLSENANLQHDPTGADGFYVECPLCGDFWISRTLGRQLGQLLKDREVAHKYAPRWVLSAAIRNRFVSDGELELDTQKIEGLLQAANQPDDLIDSIDLLLLHLSRAVSAPAELVSIQPEVDYPLAYAQDEYDFDYYLSEAVKMDLLEAFPDGYRITHEGWERLRELNEKQTDRSQAFVAMWFDDEMDEAYTHGIAPALDKTGYEPLRIDMEEHNQRIDEKIINDIRQSGLLVADFTGQRAGVYFEAGLALGLDIPVIWACRDDEVENLHFDTRQYNHILWSDPEDLREQLVSRIEATLP